MPSDCSKIHPDFSNSIRMKRVSIVILGGALAVALFFLLARETPSRGPSAEVLLGEMETKSLRDEVETAPVQRIGSQDLWHEAGAGLQYEKRLNYLLSTQAVSNKQAVTELVRFARSNSLTKEQRLEAFEHALHLVDEGESYMSQVVQTILMPEAFEQLYELFMDDLYNREPETLLKAALEIKFALRHPLQEESEELLVHFLGEDLGGDRGAWERSLDEYVSDQ